MHITNSNAFQNWAWRLCPKEEVKWLNIGRRLDRCGTDVIVLFDVIAPKIRWDHFATRDDVR
jgi:hypothetical protein